ncbi:MAG: hypothetical protein ACK53Y_25455, partial [bacterium]
DGTPHQTPRIPRLHRDRGGGVHTAQQTLGSQRAGPRHRGVPQRHHRRGPHAQRRRRHRELPVHGGLRADVRGGHHPRARPVELPARLRARRPGALLPRDARRHGGARRPGRHRGGVPGPQRPQRRTGGHQPRARTRHRLPLLGRLQRLRPVHRHVGTALPDRQRRHARRSRRVRDRPAGMGGDERAGHAA